MQVVGPRPHTDRGVFVDHGDLVARVSVGEGGALCTGYIIR